GRKVSLFERFAQALGGHQRRNIIGPARFHQVERFVVEKRSVLDGIDAGADGAFGSFGSVGVGSGFAAKGVGFVDQRVELGLRELRGVDVVGEGKNAAGRAGLDHIGAVLDIEAHGGAHSVGAVGDSVRDSRFAAEDLVGVAGIVVAMAAGGSDGG